MQGTNTPGADVTNQQNISNQPDNTGTDYNELYHSLFNSINIGFSLLDIRFDENGNATDVIIRDANEAQNKIDGVKALIGKSVREVLPNIEMKWIERYGRIARTGRDEHFTDWSESTQRWYDVNATRVGGEGSTLVALIYNDITSRKLAEEHNIYITILNDTLRTITNPAEVEAAITRISMEHFKADRCYYASIEGDKAIIRRDAARAGFASVANTYRLSDFASFKIIMTEGRSFIIPDVYTSEIMDDALKQLCIESRAISFLDVPVIKNGEVVGIFCLAQSTPRKWTDVEIELATETAERTWEAVERAKAEEALRISEAKYRTIFSSIGDGFGIMELIYDSETGTATDHRIIESNKAFETHTGLHNPAGKLASELKSDIELFWTTIYARVAETGMPEHIEKYSPALCRWFEADISRFEDAGSAPRVTVTFKDITTRKQTEANLAFLAGINESLRTLTTIDDTIHTLGEKIGRFFNVKRCLLAESSSNFEITTAVADWHAEDASALEGNYRTRDFVSAELMENLSKGEPLIINNTQTDVRVNAGNYAGLDIHSCVVIVFIHEGAWRFHISIFDSKPRNWKKEEVELMQEITSRIWAHIEQTRAEEALRYSETRLRIVAKSSGIGTWIRHLDKDSIESDERTTEIFGMPLENFSLIDSVRMLLHHDDLTAFTDAFEKSIDPQGNGVLNIEFRIYHPDGSLRWVHSVGQTFFEGEPKRPTLMVGSSIDITERKETDRIIRESEERYRAFFNQSTAAVSELDKEGNIILANDIFCTMLGYTREDILGRNIQNITHPDSLALCLENFARAINKGLASTMEKKMIRDDDSHIWITESIAPLQDENGNTRGVVAVGIDITERKKTEMFVLDSEDRYRIALEAGELATWDWNLKTDKVMWNAQHFRLFGVDHGSDTIESEYFLDFVYPEDMALVKQQLAEVVGEKGIYSAEFRIRRKDNGKLRWMTGYGRVTERENGKPTRVSGVMFDSTDRREAEDNLEAARNSLRTALEAADMGVWSMNMTYGDVDRSPRHDHLLGFSAWQEDWSPEKAKTHMLEEDKPLFDAAYESLLSEGVFNLKARIKQTDGNICWIHYYGRTFRDEDGRGETSAGVIYDITDEKTIEKQKDEFIGIASHELKTPVTSIKAYAEILQEMFEDANDKKSAELMGKLDSQVDRLTNLIKDLLDVTKVSEGQLQLVTKPFNLETTIKNVTEEMQRTSRSHAIKLTMQSLPEVVGDEERIAQVIVNMLSNAIKYSPDSKDVLVNAKYEKGKVSVSVEDSGIGMSPGTLEKLFARFFRSDNPSVRSYPGLGLGLFISMEIMKRHGGTIAVQSERGKGSIFTMVLPAG